MTQAGDIGLVESNVFLSSHDVVRVFKVGKVLWEVEKYHPDTGWGRPRRRKVAEFYRIAPENVSQAYVKTKELSETYWLEVKEAKSRYKSGIIRLAKN